MTKRVNYEDNIFFLKMLLKQLTAVFRLNLDAEIFEDKIIEDILFLDRTLDNLYDSLNGRTLMIDRLEYLKDLQKISGQFACLLEDILKKEQPFAARLENIFDKLRIIREKQQSHFTAIRDIVSDSARLQSGEANQLVSEEEFKFLLSPEEEED